MRVLFVAPVTNLKTSEEILASVTDLEVTLCTGNVDRAKLETALLGPKQFDAVHFMGHGDLSILQLSDGPVEIAELVSLIKHQRQLRFVVITACNSARVASGIHNRLHIPVVYCQAEIGDPAALRFSETFYRALRAGEPIHEAVDIGRATLERLHNGSADVVDVLNGDMATADDLSDVMRFVREQFEKQNRYIEQLTTDVASVNMRLDGMEEAMKATKTQPASTWAIIILLTLLTIAQFLNPWANVWVGAAH